MWFFNIWYHLWCAKKIMATMVHVIHYKKGLHSVLDHAGFCLLSGLWAGVSSRLIAARTYCEYNILMADFLLFSTSYQYAFNLCLPFKLVTIDTLNLFYLLIIFIHLTCVAHWLRGFILIFILLCLFVYSYLHQKVINPCGILHIKLTCQHQKVINPCGILHIKLTCQHQKVINPCGILHIKFTCQHQKVINPCGILHI